MANDRMILSEELLILDDIDEIVLIDMDDDLDDRIGFYMTIEEERIEG